MQRECTATFERGEGDLEGSDWQRFVPAVRLVASCYY